MPPYWSDVVNEHELYTKVGCHPEQEQSKMTTTRLLCVVFAISMSGCAVAPPVQTAASSKSPFDDSVFSGELAQIAKATPGEESFRSFYQGGSGFVSLASVRETVDNIATKQCSSQDRKVRLLQERISVPPYILGNFPRVEWVFECVPQSTVITAATSSNTKLEQLERLKKLLDSGALTQPEFDREKAKILGAP